LNQKFYKVDQGLKRLVLQLRINKNFESQIRLVGSADDVTKRTDKLAPIMIPCNQNPKPKTEIFFLIEDYKNARVLEGLNSSLPQSAAE